MKPNDTALERMTAALLRSERQADAGRKTAVLAHEVQNALEVIGNYLYLAQSSPAEAGRPLQSAEQEVRQIGRVTRAVLSNFRDGGPYRAMDLAEVAHDATALLGEGAARRDRTLELDVPSGMTLWGDDAQIRQALRNLAGNALDATSPGGRIVVRAHAWSTGDAGHGGCRVTIADNGHGITMEHQPQIFQLGFSTRADEGNGLGLWVVQEVVRRHRGSIRVKSRTAPGRSGTVFMLFFPAQATSQQHG